MTAVRHKAARRTHWMLKEMLAGKSLTLHRVRREFDVCGETARRYFRVLEAVYGLDTFVRNGTKFWHLDGDFLDPTK